ncbi:MAG: TadE/TadG family type IV pilus assembly protein [Nocardioidaceae bacterium]
MRKHASGRAKRATDMRGAVAIEFVLVLPLLVMLFLGTLTAGLAYSRAIGLTNAVREGARFGATADISSASWADDVLARIRETQFDDAADAASSNTIVCVQLVGATTIGPVCSPGGDNPPPLPAFTGSTPALDAGECAVLVWGARRYEITLGIVPPIDSVMNRPSTARYERSC